MNSETLVLPAAGDDAVVPEDYDNPDFQREFVEWPGAGRARASLVVGGVTCGGCVGRLERALQAIDGVLDADFNFSSSRLTLAWAPARVALSRILREIGSLGFDAQPYSQSAYRRALDEQRRRMLRQFVVALVPGMQVMMLSIALYLGDASDISAPMAEFFRWTMLLLTLPVVMYSGRAFFEPAWRSLAARRLNMDVPVALGIGVAFLMSTVNTVRGSGEVYFDSAVMFIVLLLGARLLELGARRRAAAATENMMSLTPEQALRIDPAAPEAEPERVAAIRLRAGDRVRVLPGDRIPVDGLVVQGVSSVDRAVVTGESLPEAVAAGDEVIGGSLNTDGLLEIEVTRPGTASVLSRLLCLAARAQAEKPRLGRLADRVASRFVAMVLLAATATGLWWFLADDPGWLSHLMTVLVVSCPCALSLATPAALSAGTNAMLQTGLLVIRPDAVETMSRLTDICLDKTGTLTLGRMQLAAGHYHGSLSAAECLAIAASLEQASRHPIAAALAAETEDRLPVEDLEAVPGRGVRGRVNGCACVLGQPAFVLPELADAPCAPADNEAPALTEAWFAVDGQLQARFEFRDEERADAGRFIDDLHNLGLDTHLVSGDRPDLVAAFAAEHGVRNVAGGLDPTAKLRYLESRRGEGRRCAMLGDGINDAAMLSGADLGVAIDTGADVTKAGADAVLLSRDLAAFSRALATARRVRRTMAQNLAWAAAYNLCAIPIAAAGMLAPWQAAIGMSVSSLVVVANSLRLLR